MYTYYNEIDDYCCQWLKNLMDTGHLPAGKIDNRSIKDVKADDLEEYTQCHFFAGIGGWPLALKLAGWGDMPVWTGSCPCQPFSAAGKRKGTADERHLWPEFHRLIAEYEPATVFGEQVASKDGRIWLSGVRSDLETLGYAVGAADLCAAGVEAPHIRQRLYWMAESGHERGERKRNRSGQSIGTTQAGSCDATLGSSLYFSQALGNSPSTRPQEQRSEYRPSGKRCSGFVGFAVQTGVPEWNGPTVAIECSDGYRRCSSQPNAFPMAHGVPARMGKLRGAGNSIVPQVAAEFIQAYLMTTE